MHLKCRAKKAPGKGLLVSDDGDLELACDISKVKVKGRAGVVGYSVAQEVICRGIGCCVCVVIW
jgi:hypothetical protein